MWIALFSREELNSFCHKYMKERSDSKGFYFCPCIVDADGTSKKCEVYFAAITIYNI